MDTLSSIGEMAKSGWSWFRGTRSSSSSSSSASQASQVPEISQQQERINAAALPELQRQGEASVHSEASSAPEANSSLKEKKVSKKGGFFKGVKRLAAKYLPQGVVNRGVILTNGKEFDSIIPKDFPISKERKKALLNAIVETAGPDFETLLEYEDRKFSIDDLIKDVSMFTQLMSRVNHRPEVQNILKEATLTYLKKSGKVEEEKIEQLRNLDPSLTAFQSLSLYGIQSQVSQQLEKLPSFVRSAASALLNVETLKEEVVKQLVQSYLGEEEEPAATEEARLAKVIASEFKATLNKVEEFDVERLKVELNRLKESGTEEIDFSSEEGVISFIQKLAMTHAVPKVGEVLSKWRPGSEILKQCFGKIVGEEGASIGNDLKEILTEEHINRLMEKFNEGFEAYQNLSKEQIIDKAVEIIESSEDLQTLVRHAAKIYITNFKSDQILSFFPEDFPITKEESKALVCAFIDAFGSDLTSLSKYRNQKFNLDNLIEDSELFSKMVKTLNEEQKIHRIIKEVVSIYLKKEAEVEESEINKLNDSNPPLTALQWITLYVAESQITKQLDNLSFFKKLSVSQFFNLKTFKKEITKNLLQKIQGEAVADRSERSNESDEASLARVVVNEFGDLLDKMRSEQIDTEELSEFMKVELNHLKESGADEVDLSATGRLSLEKKKLKDFAKGAVWRHLTPRLGNVVAEWLPASKFVQSFVGANAVSNNSCLGEDLKKIITEERLKKIIGKFENPEELTVKGIVEEVIQTFENDKDAQTLLKDALKIYYRYKKELEESTHPSSALSKEDEESLNSKVGQHGEELADKISQLAVDQMASSAELSKSKYQAEGIQPIEINLSKVLGNNEEEVVSINCRSFLDQIQDKGSFVDGLLGMNPPSFLKDLLTKEVPVEIKMNKSDIEKKVRLSTKIVLIRLKEMLSQKQDKLVDIFAEIFTETSKYVDEFADGRVSTVPDTELQETYRKFSSKLLTVLFPEGMDGLPIEDELKPIVFDLLPTMIIPMGCESLKESILEPGTMYEILLEGIKQIPSPDKLAKSSPDFDIESSSSDVRFERAAGQLALSCLKLADPEMKKIIENVVDLATGSRGTLQRTVGKMVAAKVEEFLGKKEFQKEGSSNSQGKDKLKNLDPGKLFDKGVEALNKRVTLDRLGKSPKTDGEEALDAVNQAKNTENLKRKLSKKVSKLKRDFLPYLEVAVYKIIGKIKFHFFTKPLLDTFGKIPVIGSILRGTLKVLDVVAFEAWGAVKTAAKTVFGWFGDLFFSSWKKEREKKAKEESDQFADRLIKKMESKSHVNFLDKILNSLRSKF